MATDIIKWRATVEVSWKDPQGRRFDDKPNRYVSFPAGKNAYRKAKRNSTL